MDFPRALFVLFSLLFVYLALQFLLFRRIRDYLRGRFQKHSQQKIFIFSVASFFLLMLTPMAWRLLYGWQAHDPYPPAVRALFTLSAVWAFGSTGSISILLAYDLFHRLLRRLSRRPVKVPDLGRREFLKKGAQAVAVAPFVVSGYGVVLGRRRFEVEDFELPLNGLSSSLSHLSVVQMTDIHVGPFMPEEELAGYVETVNRLQPDLIALTGDFVSTSPLEALPCVNALAGLKARYGVFACMGNHDVYTGADVELTDLFTEKGIHVLRNDAAAIQVKDTTVNILGIEDLRWGKPDLSRALKISQREPGEIRLLLSHRPEVFPAAAGRGVDLVLSGHYHGGQVKLAPEPDAFSIARLITPYAEGLFHLSRRSRSSGTGSKDSMLFVSRGIGITGLPIRINCPPQIAHLTLKRA